MWVKGNLHCHTTASDGDTDPSEVCGYYAEDGYHFLSITDHMARVDPSEVDAHGLLLIPGEEMHLAAEEDPAAPLHVNAIGISERVAGEGSFTKAASIQSCIDAALAAGGIAQINHPNWHYAFDHTVISQTRGALLLEVFNGHPAVNNEGDESHISVEGMWDHLLTAGMLFYAVAVDDAHHYVEFTPQRANPSRGWVWVRVPRLTEADVLEAIRRGDFYASTGVKLDDVLCDGLSLRVMVRPESGVNFITRFIGCGGRVLHESDSLDSRFELPDSGSGEYMRAKVISSDGCCAWTQPVVGS